MKHNTLIIFLLCIPEIAYSLEELPQQSSSTHQNHSMVAKKHTAMEHAKMHGMYGRYPMTREASGTSWVPDSSPQEGFHLTYKEWILMFMGFSYFITDVQRGKRGDQGLFDENMFMFMTQKDFDPCIVAFRSMFSLEPLTVGKCGYPLLLQTGETCNGKTPLIDRQHPHDLIDELALVFTYAPTEKTSIFFYAGLPGEPAIGPPTYIMRFSSEYIPETPLGHHWMDSTHITFGVLTFGFIHSGLKLEVSGFKGREPDQDRFDIEKPKIDSYSLRFSLNPTNDLAFQASYAALKSPEQLHPDVNTKRICVSSIYNKNFNDSNLQAAAILGINKNNPGRTLPSFLVEATAEIHKKHIVFSRFEIQQNDELFEEPCPFADQVFTVEKLTFGYVYEFLTAHHIKWGFGGLIDFPIVPSKIKNCYGSTTSFMFCLQMRLV